uniref:Pre-mRNA-splicing factor CWC25 n=1 Tax=Haemonchus contortus TaxID=6289 RepID=A0A7I4YCT7_HAECO
MATTLSTRQGLLTKALSRLNSALEANKDWAQAVLQLPSDEQGLQAKVDALNLPQLHKDTDELKTSLEELNSQNVVDEDPQPRAAREPSPEMERILRQMSKTERELKEVRDAMLEVNQSIEREREECKEKSGSTRTIDDLKQRRSRLQAREDRVEREMQDLERRLEREEIKRSHKRSLSHSRTREHSEGARRSSDSRSTRRDQDASRGQEKRRSSTRSMDHQHK